MRLPLIITTLLSLVLLAPPAFAVSTGFVDGFEYCDIDRFRNPYLDDQSHPLYSNLIDNVLDVYGRPHDTECYMSNADELNGVSLGTSVTTNKTCVVDADCTGILPSTSSDQCIDYVRGIEIMPRSVCADGSGNRMEDRWRCDDGTNPEYNYDCLFQEKQQNCFPNCDVGNAWLPTVCAGGSRDGEICDDSTDCLVCVGGSEPGSACTTDPDCDGGGTCPVGLCVAGVGGDYEGSGYNSAQTGVWKCGMTGGLCTGDVDCTGGDAGLECVPVPIDPDEGWTGKPHDQQECKDNTQDCLHYTDFCVEDADCTEGGLAGLGYTCQDVDTVGLAVAPMPVHYDSQCTMKLTSNGRVELQGTHVARSTVANAPYIAGIGSNFVGRICPYAEVRGLDDSPMTQGITASNDQIQFSTALSDNNLAYTFGTNVSGDDDYFTFSQGDLVRVSNLTGDGIAGLLENTDYEIQTCTTTVTLCDTITLCAGVGNCGSALDLDATDEADSDSVAIYMKFPAGDCVFDSGNSSSTYIEKAVDSTPELYTHATIWFDSFGPDSVEDALALNVDALVVSESTIVSKNIMGNLLDASGAGSFDGLAAGDPHPLYGCLLKAEKNITNGEFQVSLISGLTPSTCDLGSRNPDTTCTIGSSNTCAETTIGEAVCESPSYGSAILEVRLSDEVTQKGWVEIAIGEDHSDNALTCQLFIDGNNAGSSTVKTGTCTEDGWACASQADCQEESGGNTYDGRCEGWFDYTRTGTNLNGVTGYSATISSNRCWEDNDCTTMDWKFCSEDGTTICEVDGDCSGSCNVEPLCIAQTCDASPIPNIINTYVGFKDSHTETQKVVGRCPQTGAICTTPSALNSGTLCKTCDGGTYDGDFCGDETTMCTGGTCTTDAINCTISYESLTGAGEYTMFVDDWAAVTTSIAPVKNMIVKRFYPDWEPSSVHTQWSPLGGCTLSNETKSQSSGGNYNFQCVDDLRYSRALDPKVVSTDSRWCGDTLNEADTAVKCEVDGDCSASNFCDLVSPYKVTTGYTALASEESFIQASLLPVGARVALKENATGNKQILKMSQFDLDTVGTGIGDFGPCGPICVGGGTPGISCVETADCLSCVGGSEPGSACTTDPDCAGGGTCEGTCPSGGADPELITLTCTAGSEPGSSCTIDSDCAGGGTCDGVAIYPGECANLTTQLCYIDADCQQSLHAQTAVEFVVIGQDDGECPWGWSGTSCNVADATEPNSSNDAGNTKTVTTNIMKGDIGANSEYDCTVSSEEHCVVGDTYNLLNKMVSNQIAPMARGYTEVPPVGVCRDGTTACQTDANCTGGFDGDCINMQERKCSEDGTTLCTVDADCSGTCVYPAWTNDLTGTANAFNWSWANTGINLENIKSGSTGGSSHATAILGNLIVQTPKKQFPRALRDVNDDGRKTFCMAGDSTYSPSELHLAVMSEIRGIDDVIFYTRGSITSEDIRDNFEQLMDGIEPSDGAYHANVKVGALCDPTAANLPPDGTVCRGCDYLLIGIGVNSSTSNIDRFVDGCTTVLGGIACGESCYTEATCTTDEDCPTGPAYCGGLATEAGESCLTDADCAGDTCNSADSRFGGCITDPRNGAQSICKVPCQDGFCHSPGNADSGNACSCDRNSGSAFLDQTNKKYCWYCDPTDGDCNIASGKFPDDVANECTSSEDCYATGQNAYSQYIQRHECTASTCDTGEFAGNSCSIWQDCAETSFHRCVSACPRSPGCPDGLCVAAKMSTGSLIEDYTAYLSTTDDRKAQPTCAEDLDCETGLCAGDADVACNINNDCTGLTPDTCDTGADAPDGTCESSQCTGDDIELIMVGQSQGTPGIGSYNATGQAGVSFLHFYKDFEYQANHLVKLAEARGVKWIDHNKWFSNKCPDNNPGLCTADSIHYNVTGSQLTGTLFGLCLNNKTEDCDYFNDPFNANCQDNPLGNILYDGSVADGRCHYRQTVACSAHTDCNGTTYTNKCLGGNDDADTCNVDTDCDSGSCIAMDALDTCVAGTASPPGYAYFHCDFSTD